MNLKTLFVTTLATAWVAGCGTADFTDVGAADQSLGENGQADAPSDSFSAAPQQADNPSDAAATDPDPAPPAEGEAPPSEAPPSEGGDCAITHFTSGEESRFRVEGNGDCIRCPGPGDVVTLTYTGAGFTQSLEFNGDETNGPGASSDELILEEQGNVCWSEDYDAGADLPSASALTGDGHAATIEFDKGPDSAGPSGTLSYYLNGSLVFSLDIAEGDVAAYPDDGVTLD